MLYCASLLLAFFASPVLAQQAVPEHQIQLAQQVAQSQPAQPATTEAQSPPTSVAPLPPPFPPMPSSRPSHRWVDVGERHAARTHHKAAVTRHTRTSDFRHRKLAAEDRQSRHHRGRSDVRRSHRKLAEEHASPRTIRRCHDLSYRQIMRSSSCRALMKQELSGTEHRDRHASRHHKTASRHQKAALRRQKVSSQRRLAKEHRHTGRKHRK